jgi:hypothetical protein
MKTEGDGSIILVNVSCLELLHSFSYPLYFHTLPHSLILAKAEALSFQRVPHSLTRALRVGVPPTPVCFAQWRTLPRDMPANFPWRVGKPSHVGEPIGSKYGVSSFPVPRFRAAASDSRRCRASELPTPANQCRRELQGDRHARPRSDRSSRSIPS